MPNSISEKIQNYFRNKVFLKIYQFQLGYDNNCELHSRGTHWVEGTINSTTLRRWWGKLPHHPRLGCGVKVGAQPQLVEKIKKF